MRIQCKGCKIEFQIPGDKVPAGKVLKIVCPRCKTIAEISSREPDMTDPSGDEAILNEAGSDQLLDYVDAVDMVDEGVRTALLCVGNRKVAERIAQALQELDFWVVHALQPGFALGKLHHNRYDLMILEESFNASQHSSNLVLHHVQLLPMHQRRQFFFCLLSTDKPTLDSKLAFNMGVNLILNVEDIEKAKIILSREMKEYRNFYSLFNTELAKKG